MRVDAPLSHIHVSSPTCQADSPSPEPSLHSPVSSALKVEAWTVPYSWLSFLAPTSLATAISASSFDVGRTAAAACPRPLHPLHSLTMQFTTLCPFLPPLKHRPVKVLSSAALALLPSLPVVATESPLDSPLRYGPLSPALPGWFG